MSAAVDSIAGVDPFIIRIPYKQVLSDSRRNHSRSSDSQTSLLVRVRGQSGQEGWGEVGVSPQRDGLDAAQLIQSINRILAPAVLGVEIGNFALMHRRMDSAVSGYYRIKAAIESAAYDLLGKAVGLPVWKLLGGKVHDTVAVLGWVMAPTAEECCQKAKVYVDAGFDTLKVKVGFGPAKDEEVVRAVRKAVGDKIVLRVDANCIYSRDDALESLRRLEPYEIFHYEDPIAGKDLEGMAWLRKKVPVRLMADESCITPEDLIRVIRADAADIVKLSVQVNGGIHKTVQMMRIAQAAGIPATLGHSGSLTTGALAEMHVAATAPNLLSPCEFVGLLKSADDVVREPLDLIRVKVPVPDRPGLGSEIDTDKFRKYRLAVL
jgi:muconate cycloisomerase